MEGYTIYNFYMKLFFELLLFNKYYAIFKNYFFIIYVCLVQYLRRIKTCLNTLGSNEGVSLIEITLVSFENTHCIYYIYLLTVFIKLESC